MVLTSSSMKLALGTAAPGFRLPDASGREWSLGDFGAADAVLLAFICNHCPYVKHIRKGFAQLAREYSARGVAVVGINSNDFAAYPDDAPDRMREESALAGYDFPYLVDETQQVAKDYGAACTPDFFVLDRQCSLFYRGQMDESRPGSDAAVSGADLRRALDDALANRAAPAEQTPSLGCNIKWKPGNEPDYLG